MKGVGAALDRLTSEKFTFSALAAKKGRSLFTLRVQSFTPCAFVGTILFLIAWSAGASLSLAAQQSVPTPTAGSPLDRADALLKANKAAEALALLTPLAQKDPKIPGLERELGKAYLVARQFPQAVTHLQSARQQNPDDPESSQLLALSFYGEGNFRDALPLLEKFGAAKESPDAPYLLSICYVMTQQWESARKSLAQMFSVSPDSAMAYLSLGKLLVRQQMVQAAVPQIETALRLDPHIAMAHFLLGEIDLYQSKPQAAITEFQKELALNPTLWLVYWRLGDAEIRLGNYDEAEKVLKKAIWLNEASPGAYVLLGQIAQKKNDPVLASGFLERAVALDDQNLEAHEALANIYKKLGRESDANRELEISTRLRNERHSVGTDTLRPGLSGER